MLEYPVVNDLAKLPSLKGLLHVCHSDMAPGRLTRDSVVGSQE